MATLTVYSETGAAGGYLTCSSTAYATARAGTGTKTATTTGTTGFVGQRLLTSTYYVYQSFISFDTAAANLGDVVISDADLQVYINTDTSTTDFTLMAYRADFGPTVEVADFIAGASLPDYSQFGTLSTVGMTLGLKAFTMALNANTLVPVSGNARFVIASNRQAYNNTPTTTEYIQFRSADYTGTTSDPRLVLTTAPAPDTAAPTMTGVSTDPSPVPSNATYQVRFTASDNKATSLPYSIRTGAGGTGSALKSGTAQSGVAHATGLFVDSSLVAGVATQRYIYINDGSGNYLDRPFVVTRQFRNLATTLSVKTTPSARPIRRARRSLRSSTSPQSLPKRDTTRRLTTTTPSMSAVYRQAQCVVGAVTGGLSGVFRTTRARLASSAGDLSGVFRATTRMLGATTLPRATSRVGVIEAITWVISFLATTGSSAAIRRRVTRMVCASTQATATPWRKTLRKANVTSDGQISLVRKTKRSLSASTASMTRVLGDWFDMVVHQVLLRVTTLPGVSLRRSTARRLTAQQATTARATRKTARRLAATTTGLSQAKRRTGRLLGAVTVSGISALMGFQGIYHLLVAAATGSSAATLRRTRRVLSATTLPLAQVSTRLTRLRQKIWGTMATVAEVTGTLRKRG